MLKYVIYEKLQVNENGNTSLDGLIEIKMLKYVIYEKLQVNEKGNT